MPLMDFKKLLPIVLILFVLLGCAGTPKSGHFTADCDYVYDDSGKVSLVCVQVDVTPQPTSSITPSPLPPTPSPTVRPTTTVVPSATPTTVPTAVPTVTATPVPSNVNLFLNPGFEGGASPYEWALASGPLKLPEVAVVQAWKPFFCDFPYKAGPCPALFQGTKNPSNLMMGRPEMRNTVIGVRIHGGSGAQYWFCQFRTCDGGVYQTVRTTPGQVCSVSAYVQSWSRQDWNPRLPDDQNFKSEFPNEDGYSNSLWRIAVDPYGGVNIDSTNVISTSWYSLPHSIAAINGQAIQVLDHYDKYALITYTFTAKGSFATVYFENLRLFPFTFNDSMVDDASIFCSGGNGLPASPTPTSTVVPTTVATVVPSQDCASYYSCFTDSNAYYQIVVDVLNVRSTRDYSSSANILSAYHKGDEIKVHCVVKGNAETYWGSVSPCLPEPHNWFVLQLGGVDNAIPLPGPEG